MRRIRRREIFEELDKRGMFDGVRLQTEHEEELVRLLDTVVIKLEGGSEEDLKILSGYEGTEDKVVEEATQQLHLTRSLFLRSVDPTVSVSELESVCQNYPSYLRLCLSQPDPAKNWTRRAWLTFALPRHSQIQGRLWTTVTSTLEASMTNYSHSCIVVSLH